MKYKYLKHTADLKVRAYGKTLEQAFANMVLGAFGFLTDTSKIQKRIEKKISISAKRAGALLYDFIGELLFLMDTEGFIISSFKDMKIKQQKENYRLDCIAQGDNFKKYEVKGDIKAVTYSEMLIKKEKSGYIIEVVFDI